MKEFCDRHPNAPPSLIHGSHPHAAGLRCSQCDAFIGWLKRSDPRVRLLPPKSSIQLDLADFVIPDRR